MYKEENDSNHSKSKFYQHAKVSSNDNKIEESDENYFRGSIKGKY